jgi:spore coat polysaccharide biosynthesis protein SpsF
MRVVAIVQARMGSTRLPGKIMMELAGEPVLVRCINRIHRAQKLDEVVIATTIKPADDIVVRWCAQHGWSCFRGSEEDVLDRYYRAAVKYKADVIVRITSDCPLIEPEIVDLVVQEFLERQPEADYVSNCFPQRSYPRGLDTEVMRQDVLGRVWREDQNPAWREHVTTYIQRNLDSFSIHDVVNETDYSHMRWTLDTPEDLTFLCHIYDHFGHDLFSWREVLGLLEQNPGWLEINRHVPQKVVL